MLYTCPRENFPRITTMNHAHLELEMCKIQEIRMSRERAGERTEEGHDSYRAVSDIYVGKFLVDVLER